MHQLLAHFCISHQCEQVHEGRERRVDGDLGCDTNWCVERTDYDAAVGRTDGRLSRHPGAVEAAVRRCRQQRIRQAGVGTAPES